MYIDSHTHLYDEEFRQDLDEVLKRAQDAGVEWLIVPGTNVETSRGAIALAERYPFVSACVGIHPHEAGKVGEGDLQTIEELTHHPAVVAVGEIGLDYHYNFAPATAQQQVFREQVLMAARRQLPVVVHTRESIDDAVAMVQDVVEHNAGWGENLLNVHTRSPAGRGVFHCFMGSAEEAWRLLELGFYVSYPGIVTFKNSPVLGTLSRIGFDHILLETDSPYLAPVPMRGKRNEPSFLPLVAQKIASLFEVLPEDVARTARFNTKRLFRIGEPDQPRIVYQLRNSLYVNMTIRCNADCVFCDRKGSAVVKGYNLKIEHEPSPEELIEAIGDPTRYEEVVFCGYGEPTIRLEVLKTVARWIKQQGGRVRLNTDGHGSIINHRNIVPELAGLVDVVSISLNSADPEQYGRLMRVDGDRHFKAMTEFALECKKVIGGVNMTLVDVPEVDKERARTFVEKDLGLTLRVRPFF